MKTETLFDQAVNSLKAYYQGEGNYHRGEAVDLTQRIVDLTGQDHNQVWEEIEAAAR